MRRKKAEEQGPAAAPAGAGARIQPMDVQQVEFRLAFRGYNERDVDAFLDRITEDLSSYIEESQRLREGSGAAAPLAAGAGSAENARAEAEEIVARAREEAATIVREAEMRAAGGDALTGEARAAVAPFLNREREFLQSLGSLVQGHAEEIKQMVLAVRARSEAAPAPAAPVEPADVTQTPAPTPSPEPVAETPDDSPSRAEAAASRGEAAAEPSDVATSDDAFAPIRVPASEETTGSEPGSEPAETPTPAPAGVRRDSGERSLRELFWGED